MNEGFSERPVPNIEYVGYVNNKAIARDEWGELYYNEIPQEFIEIGEVALLTDLTPLSDLSAAEQNDIENQILELLAERNLFGDI